MPPCLTLSIIRYESRVKWSNPGKGVAPSPTPWCSSYGKGEFSSHPRLWSPTLLYLYIQRTFFFINRVVSTGQSGVPFNKKKYFLTLLCQFHYCQFHVFNNMHIFIRDLPHNIYTQMRYSNDYCRRDWTCQPVLNSLTRLFAFHIALMILEKVKIHLFSLKQ